MSNTYTYNGVPCTIKNRFADSELMQIKVSGEVLTVRKQQVIETTNKVVVLNQSKEKVSTPKAIATPPGEPTLFETAEEQVNINKVSQSEMTKLKGIGNLSARTIIKNKPEGGYQDIEQLKSLNTELERLNWEHIEHLITF